MSRRRRLQPKAHAAREEPRKSKKRRTAQRGEMSGGYPHYSLVQRERVRGVPSLLRHVERAGGARVQAHEARVLELRQRVLAGRVRLRLWDHGAGSNTSRSIQKGLNRLQGLNVGRMKPTRVEAPPVTPRGISRPQAAFENPVFRTPVSEVEQISNTNRTRARTASSATRMSAARADAAAGRSSSWRCTCAVGDGCSAAGAWVGVRGYVSPDLCITFEERSGARVCTGNNAKRDAGASHLEVSGEEAGEVRLDILGVEIRILRGRWTSNNT